MYLPQYDELYVISDIHMGGEKEGVVDFQIFNRGKRLAGLVHHLTEHRANDRIALVLNGDIIDSLAEKALTGYVALDTATALGVMERIYADASFAPVWEALAGFVGTPKRYLILALGNHDIELALPPVEASVRRRLAPEDDAAQARIVFATHGSGFACRVGQARIFCTHGNEVDDWNQVDFDTLAQLGNAINAGRQIRPERWKPNAGTRLVVDVMNRVKRRYPFVDLLKPETSAVLGVLLTLDPDALKKIDLLDAFPILRDKVRGGLVTRRLLSAQGDDLAAVAPAAAAEVASETLLGASLRGALNERRVASAASDSEDELLLAAGRALAAGESASSVVAREGEEGTLGWGDIFWGRIGAIDKVEALRRALQDWLQDDTTFETDTRDSTFHGITARVGPDVDFVITGHTHLARAMEFAPGRYYFNCGTWIRLIRLTTEVLADQASFAGTAYRAFASGRMADLDEARIPGPGKELIPLVFDRSNVVRVCADAQGVTGELLRVTDAGTGVRLRPEPKTMPFRV
jgi:UDP-2,3-diacylglucosamine pyrophosphatase LpxH